MNNKKAFTLIELLAVIVVLAIILTITIPIISNIVTSARKASFKSDARLVLDQVRLQKDQDEEFDPTSINYNTLSTYNLSNQNYESLTISVIDNKPYIYVVGKNKWAGFKACGTYNDMGVFEVTELGTCQGDGPVTFPKVTDSNPGVICTDYSTDSICYIKSVEDLVGFSQSVGSGKDYTGKTVILINGLDINDNKSYVNSNTTSMGDVNGDGTTSGLLTEMTTGKGFNPIGSDVNQFKGTFEGNANTIGNLLINRPAQSYTGLFGYNSGIIRGLNIKTINITGAAYTGGIAGYNNGDINTIAFQGTVTAVGSYGGGENAGGITGYNNTGKIISNILVDVNMTNGGRWTGGVAGYNAGTINAIFEHGSVSGVQFGFTGRITTGAAANAYAAENIVAGGCVDGTSFSTNAIGDINAYDTILDTWIGGDNDSDGYYFDYDSDNNIVLKSITTSPIIFTLAGSGTSEEPYLINNAADWRQAATKTKLGYTFKLTSDINFASTRYYELGYFNGVFDGDNHTLSNVSFYTFTNGGLFGYNNGTIKGLNVINLNLIGISYTGGIAGYNTGTIKDFNIENLNLTGGGNYTGGVAGYNSGNINTIAFQGNVTAKGTYAGGLVGLHDSAGSINNVLVDIVITNTGPYTGGIAGYSNTANINGIVEHGSITGITSLYNGKITVASVGAYAYSAENVTINGNQSRNGTSFSANAVGDINAYDTALDTYIGGDNDSDGYYFDYNASDNIVLKSTALNPITFNLAGSGTTADPYLINNAADWRQAASKTRLGYTFKLTSDINFASTRYYELGYFNGVFDGDNHTLSNVSFYTFTNGGLFGYNNGTIKGLNVINLNLIGISYTGGIAGYNTGTIKDFNIENLNLTGGGDYTGGVVGYNSGNINTIAFQGNVTAKGTFGGGLVGLHDSAGSINNVLVDIVITNTGSYTGGIAGYSNTANINGIVEHGSITGISSYNGKITVAGCGAYAYAAEDVTRNGNASRDGISFSTTYVNSLSKYDEYMLDTKYGGDNDSDDYYFDYNSDSSNIIVKSIVKYPIVTTPVTYPDVEEPAGTDSNESSCSIASSCTAQGTKSMRCGYTYLYNSNPISGYQSGYTFSMTKGSSCATAVADNTDGGLIIYSNKKSTATGVCSVVLKITATGGTYNCASVKYSSFTFN